MFVNQYKQSMAKLEKISKLLIAYRLHSIHKTQQADLDSRPKTALTQEEREAVHKEMSTHFPGLRYDIRWFEAYKYFHGTVNPKSIPEDIWTLYEPIANPSRYNSLQHKGLLHRHISPEVLPTIIVNKLNGVLLDKNDQLISDEQAIGLLLNQTDFIYKPTIGTGGGKGIQFFHIDDNNREEQKEKIKEILKGQNFICQEILEGNTKLTKYNKNPRTVNTLRCVTFCMNGKASLFGMYLRMTAGDTINDNVSFSTKTNKDVATANCYVGILPGGILSEFGLCRADRAKKFYESPSGIKFAGEKLEDYERIKEFVTDTHQRRFPMLGFIAWDITIDKNDTIRVVEINLDSQDIDDHHLFNPSVFEEKFEEYCECVNKKLTFNITYK